MPVAAHFSRPLAKIFASLAMLVGLLVLIGWAFHVPILTTVFPGYVNMKFNAALCFVLCGTALLLGIRESSPGGSRTIALLCGIVALIAVATLVEYISHIGLGIDQSVFRDFPITPGTSNPGRMAPNTAFLFLLISLALVVLPRGAGGVVAAQLIAVLCFFNVLIPAVGYFFHAQMFVSVFSLTRLAVHTIVGFYFLIFGILLARVGQGFTGVFLADNAAGYVSRRLLIPILFAPPLIGWVCYLGYGAHLYDLGFLCSLFVFCTTAVVFALTALTVAALKKSETAREALIASETAARVREQSALEAARLKSNFLAMMSHEIRNPMNSVLGYSSLLRHTLLDEEQAEYVSMINSSGEILLRVVDDVLDHSRIEAGRLEIVAEEFDPVAAVRIVGNHFARIAEVEGLGLSVEHRGDIPARVLGDEKRLRQILANLVSNAIKFTPTGKISITMNSISVPEQLGSIRLEFEVRDTGGGIRPEDLDKLFKPFSQVDAGRHQQVSSSGLGLAICRELTQLMGGEIEVSSDYGKGTCFRFGILVKEAGKPSPVANGTVPIVKASASDLKHSGLEILIAEDDAPTRMLMNRFLKKFGYSAQFAHNGEEAVRMAVAQRWDVIFMDVNMPIVGGLEATHRIREEEASRGPLAGRVRIIGLTANVFDPQDVRFASAGMDDCLLKPINYDSFSSLLESVTPAVPQSL